MYHHVKRATRHLIFWSLVIAAIILTAIRLWLSGVEHYKTSLETRLGAQIGAPVKLGALGAKMRGITPELVLKKISVASAIQTEKPALSLEEIRLGLNLGELLYNRDILAASRISLVGANLSIYRNADDKIVLEGLRTDESQPLWLLQGRHYQLLHSRVTWQDRKLGGTPLQLDDVNLAIVNEGDHHRVNILAQLPEKYGKEIKLIIDIQGSPEKLTELKGSLYMEGKTVRLPELTDIYLPYNNHVVGGFADFKIWGVLNRLKLTSLTGDVQIENAVFIHPGKENLLVNKLDTRLRWRQNETGWNFDCYRFVLESGGKNKSQNIKWPDAIFSLASTIKPQPGGRVYKAYIKELDLAEIRKLSDFFVPLPEKLARFFMDSRLEGFLQDSYQYLDPDNNSFAVSGHFDAFSTAPFQNYPGITNLQGKLTGSEIAGIIELHSSNTLFKKDNIFHKALPLEKLSALLFWKQYDKQWEIDSPSILLESQSIKSDSRLHIEIPKTEDQPFIDLQTAFTIEDVRQVKDYLPTPVMKPKLHDWLIKAFEKGEVSHGEILWYGNLGDFPYTDGNGVFQVLMAMNNVSLHYHPDWLSITGIKGSLLIEKNTINGRFAKGLIGKTDITNTEMTISGLNSDPEIAIKGEAQGQITDILTVLQQSPLKERITSMLANTKVSGKTHGTMNLNIPLHMEKEISLSGSAKLDNANLTLSTPDLRITGITGELKFNKQGIYANSIRANVLNKSVTTDISQQTNATVIKTQGKVNAAEVLKLFKWYDSQALEGESNYQLQIEMPNETTGNQPVKVKIESNLEGIAANLSGIFNKTPIQRKPTEITLIFGSGTVVPITLDYDNALKAAFYLDTAERKVVSGNIIMGKGEVDFNHSAGVKLEINKEQLALQDWLAIAADRKQALDSWLPVNEIKIHSDTAFWHKTKIGAFDLKLKNNDNAWSGDIDSIYAKGSFEIPTQLNGTIPISLNMEMLNLSALKQLNPEASGSESDFKTLIKIKSNKTLWRTVNLGKLELDTMRVPRGLSIKQFNLEGPDEKLTMTGDWVDNQLGSSTQVNGTLDLKKADQFFNKLNITKDFTDTKGRVDFKLNWNRAPWRLTLPDLRGTMDIKLKNGRILSIEPGFGRVLGILAVAQWIKRLQLDFSDVFEEGLTFNSIKGHFDLMNGKALTQDLTIDAVPAMITITGDTDLIKQTVDHTIKVVPKSYDAVPIAGTIVGKVAELIGKSITGKDQAGFFFGREYLVKGEWDKINIKPLHENDGLLQKTWNSITDFPWLEPTERDNGITQ